jgi:hypothetical protein
MRIPHIHYRWAANLEKEQITCGVAIRQDTARKNAAAAAVRRLVRNHRPADYWSGK